MDQSLALNLLYGLSCSWFHSSSALASWVLGYMPDWRMWASCYIISLTISPFISCKQFICPINICLCVLLACLSLHAAYLTPKILLKSYKHIINMCIFAFVYMYIYYASLCLPCVWIYMLISCCEYKHVCRLVAEVRYISWLCSTLFREMDSVFH